MTDFLVRCFIKHPQQIQNPATRKAYGQLAGIVGVIINILLFITKWLIGFFINSISIMADATNNFSDAASSFITWVGFHFASKPADKEHPYGHARIEYMTGLFISALIFFIGFEFAKSSVQKIITPEPVSIGIVPCFLLILSVLSKTWLSHFYFTLAKRIDSTALLAAGTDSRNDAIGTSLVLFGLLLSVVFHWQLDGVLGLLLALWILYSGICLIRDTLNPLLGCAASPELVNALQQKILSYPHILGAHDLMIHDYGPNCCYASVHVEIDARENILRSHAIIDQIERDFHEIEQIHLVIHHDPILIEPENTNHIHTKLQRCLHTISPDLSFHDLFIQEKPEETLLIFDVVKTNQIKLDDAQLKKEIQKRFQMENQEKNYLLCITIDHGFAPYHQNNTI